MKVVLVVALSVATLWSTKGRAGESSALGLDAKRKSVSLNFFDEPKTLDPERASDILAVMVLGHIGEGLVRLDPANRPVPAAAERWELKDAKTYVFKLRKAAVWSDGQPLTAKDFVYGWRRAVDPKLSADYAFMLDFVLNGRAVRDGKLPLESLGVTAIDDGTLEVKLERPTEFFLRVLNLPTFYPARADVVAKEGMRYAAEANAMAFNGPFTLTSWDHDKSMTLTKNERYWNHAEIKLDEISMPLLVRERDAEFKFFRDGRFAMTWSLSKELLATAEKAKIPLRKYNYGTVWYLEPNAKRALTGNRDFRKALQLALDRNEFVTKIQGIPGSRPIYGMVPDYMPGVSGRYGEEFPLVLKDAQLAAAKESLAKAKKTLGLAAFPPIAVLASDADDVRRDMEYFRDYFKKTLGLELKLDFQPFKERLERMDRGEFDLVNAGWGPDYLDAMTFADLFTSWNRHNTTGWASPEYDRLIEAARDATEPKTRLTAISQAEHLLVDDAVVIPYYQQYRVYVQDPRLVGVVRRTVGADPDFYYARIAAPGAASAKAP